MDFDELQQEIARFVYDDRVDLAFAALDEFGDGTVSARDRARLARLRGAVLIHANAPFPEVVRHLRQALTEAVLYPGDYAAVCVDLLATAQMAGDLSLAAEAYGLWQTLEERHPYDEEVRALKGRVTLSLAWVEHLRGNAKAAVALFREVAEIYERTQRHPREQAAQGTQVAFAWIYYAREQIRAGDLVKARFGLGGARTLIDEKHYVWPLYCCVEAELALILHEPEKAGAWLEKVTHPVRHKDAQVLLPMMKARLARYRGDTSGAPQQYLTEARRLLARHYRAYLDRELSTLF